jgi:hypothetical protein
MLRSFELLFAYGLKYPDSEFAELAVTSDNYTQDAIVDLFSYKLRTALDRLLEEHALYLKPETSLETCNEIVAGVFLLQNLADYSMVAEILESYLDHEEQLIAILGYVSALNDIQLADAFSKTDGVFLTALRNFITQRSVTPAVEHSDDEGPLLVKLKRFRQFIDSNSALGITLLEDGVPCALPLEQYLGHLQHLDQTTLALPQLALDILSVLLLSPDSYQLPLLAYRKHSHGFITDLTTISQVDAIITHILNDFERYRLDGVSHE